MTIQRDVARYGKWTSSADVLVSYRYLGCRSVVVDADHATGQMPLRSDMRWSAGLLGAPLAIAMLDTAGISIDGIRFGALTHVAIQIHEAAEAVRAVRIDGAVTRMAQRAVFTECVISAQDDPSRVVAHGTADWISMGEVAAGFMYTDPGPGVPDDPPMPPMYEAYFVESAPDGSYTIPALRPEIGDRLLHHGPNMVALEWHANDLANRAAPGEALQLRTFDVRMLRGATRPPFVTRSRGSGRRDGTVWARAELVDDGGKGEVLSQIELVFRAGLS
ncbi:MAG TPA: hypothetical protein VF065_16865 [Ilumatobacter sp.]